MRSVPPFAALVRRIRGSRSPAEFARVLGVHPRSVYKLERGERRSPRVETLRLLAADGGLTIDEVLATLRPRSRTGRPRRHSV